MARDMTTIYCNSLHQSEVEEFIIGITKILKAIKPEWEFDYELDWERVKDDEPANS